MSAYTSPHDEPWFSDPHEPWGGSRRTREIDPDEAYERLRDNLMDEKDNEGGEEV